MNGKYMLIIGCSGFVALLLTSASSGLAEEKRHSYKSVCTVAHPESICTENNTCGSPSNPCTIDVKRTSDSAAAIANTVESKANAPFCLKTGTKVTWQSLSKNTGFVIDFGASSPFDPPSTVIGGSDRFVTVVAKTPGCFKYSTGACVSGATYGMCDSVEGDFIIVGSN
jgi:hypothetical protein